MTVLGAQLCPCKASPADVVSGYHPFDNTHRVSCRKCGRAAMSLADWNRAVEVELAGGVGFPGVAIPADPIRTRRVCPDKVLRNTGATFVCEIPKGAQVCTFNGFLVIAHADFPVQVIRLSDGVAQEVIFGPVVP